MPGPRNPLFDDVSRLFSDAAGVADGVRREAETLMRTQVERLLSRMNIVTREEFEAVKEMAARARDENDQLEKRLADLQSQLAGRLPTQPL